MFSIITNGHNWKIQPVPIGLVYLSGASKGLHDVLEYHYDHFQNLHPKANPCYWNPSISWHNKWQNGDPANGERFPGSSTIFVSLTDASHLTNSISKYTAIAAIVIKIGQKQEWKYYLYDFVIYTFAYSAGFWTTYEILYK